MTCGPSRANSAQVLSTRYLTPVIGSRRLREPELMINPANTPCSAFDQHRLIARGPLNDVARAAKRVGYSSTAGPVLIFDDHNSLQVELDFRGTPDDLLARLAMEAVERFMQAMTGDLAGILPGRARTIRRADGTLARRCARSSASAGGASLGRSSAQMRAQPRHRKQDLPSARRVTADLCTDRDVTFATPSKNQSKGFPHAKTTQ